MQRQVEALVRTDEAPIPAVGVMMPHAGYVFSGAVAGRVLGAVQVPPRVILLCPNHTGRGARIAVASTPAFRIPGHEIPVDGELAAAIVDEVAGARFDDEAHRREHAIEVLLPLLFHRQPDLSIVPIVLGGLDEDQTIAVGDGLHRAVTQTGGPVMVVASSDMSHYLPDDQARRIDRLALAPLLDFDPRRLYRTVVEHDISMCGFIPATAMLAYAARAGATHARLLDYATSGDAFGDRDRVVGYAGVIVS